MFQSPIESSYLGIHLRSKGEVKVLQRFYIQTNVFTARSCSYWALVDDSDSGWLKKAFEGTSQLSEAFSDRPINLIESLLSY
jgi:hypothetical protein